MVTELTNRQKWEVAATHGLVSAASLVVFLIVFEVRTKPTRVQLTFWDFWRFYGITNIITISLVFGLIMALQKRRLFTKSDSLVWLWPLAPALITLAPFVLYVGRDHVIPLYFALWMYFGGFCAILVIVNKMLQMIHKRRYG